MLTLAFLNKEKVKKKKKKRKREGQSTDEVRDSEMLIIYSKAAFVPSPVFGLTSKRRKEDDAAQAESYKKTITRPQIEK